MDPRLERIHNAADYLKEQLGERKPVIGIVLGSGLGKLADEVKDQLVIPYKTIPGFPSSTAIGHKGNFIIGKLGGKELPINDKRMTRFLISNQQVVDMVYYALEKQLGGEIFVPKMGSYHITDLATAIAPNMSQKEVGRRVGEKLHEDIIANSDADNTIETNKFYVIIPSVSYVKNRSKEDFLKHYDAQEVSGDFHYSSDTNTQMETVESLRETIRRYVDFNFRLR